MGIPVKLKIDSFTYLGEEFNKGDVFDAPHETFASFLCEQEGTAERVDESDCKPAKLGTMKRVLKSKGGNVNKADNAAYGTKVMHPAATGGSSNVKPVKTRTGSPKASAKAKEQASEKSNVKAVSDASTENT